MQPLLHRYTEGIKCRVFVTTFTGAAQQWFNQLPVGFIRSFQEFRSLFLHQFASSRKVRKTELNLFAILQGEDEPLKEYLQRFNTVALEVPAATQEVKNQMPSPKALLDSLGARTSSSPGQESVSLPHFDTTKSHLWLEAERD
ncbi:UNVERIFIED_CONTAM: hypothetical protein Sradi_6953300 [Sesamum radiatum]|uniref:Retrotransposon gag domain-containing protein n=1 Tax=Sesamum radiatum TaxID=300843 RepID=A0AAW2JFQ0_SESRA